MFSKKWLLALILFTFLVTSFLVTSPVVSAQQDGLKVSINPSNFTVASGGEVHFMVKLTYNGKPLKNKAISFNSSKGIINPPGGFTNSEGGISLTLNAPKVSEKTQVEITAAVDPYSYPEKTKTITGTVRVNSTPFIVVRDLEISKKSFRADETVNVTAKVINRGGKGSEQISLYINNKLENEKEIQIDTGEEKTIRFPISMQKPGNYTIKVGAKTESISVKEPKIELKNLQISPKNASIGEKISISLEAKNKINKTVNTTLDCSVNGVTISSEQINISPNGKKTVTFETSRSSEGTYLVKIRNLSEKFRVQNNQEIPGFTATLALVGLLSASILYYTIEKEK